MRWAHEGRTWWGPSSSSSSPPRHRPRASQTAGRGGRGGRPGPGTAAYLQSQILLCLKHGTKLKLGRYLQTDRGCKNQFCLNWSWFKVWSFWVEGCGSRCVRLYLWWWWRCSWWLLQRWLEPPRLCPVEDRRGQEGPRHPRRPVASRPWERCNQQTNSRLNQRTARKQKHSLDQSELIYLSAIIAAAASRRMIEDRWDSLRPSSETPSEANPGRASSLEQWVRVERSSNCTSSSSSFVSFSISLGTRERRASAPAGRRGKPTIKPWTVLMNAYRRTSAAACDLLPWGHAPWPLKHQLSPQSLNSRFEFSCWCWESELTCRQQSEVAQHLVDVPRAGERGVIQQLTERREQGGGEDGLPAGGGDRTHTWTLNSFKAPELSERFKKWHKRIPTNILNLSKKLC